MGGQSYKRGLQGPGQGASSEVCSCVLSRLSFKQFRFQVIKREEVPMHPHLLSLKYLPHLVSIRQALLRFPE